MFALAELADRGIGRWIKGERGVPGFEDGGGWQRDLLTGLGVAADLVEIDGLQLQAVDDEHSGVAGLEIDEHLCLRRNLCGGARGIDLLDDSGETLPIASGDGDRDADADGDEAGGDDEAGHEQRELRTPEVDSHGAILPGCG